MRHERTTGREIAVLAVRGLERQLRISLNGERMRGLPNLGTRKHPYYAVRLVASKERNELPVDGRSVLVLNSEGVLEVAGIKPGSKFDEVERRPLMDEELLSEDVPKVVSTVAETLDRHVDMTNSRTEEIKKLKLFSLSLLDLLETYK